MIFLKRLFLLMLFCVPCVAGAQVATTAGSNLTAWNGDTGATNNNNWNQLMNSRTQTGGTTAKADFGNCNSLVMRCAQPKCAGCTTMDLARTVVEGCVTASAECKKHGAELVEYISAQIVANANAKYQEQQLAMQQAAAQQAAAQNSQQLQQMQAQMQQMQYDMQQQNAMQMQQMQAALEEQKALAAAAQAEALAAQEARNQASQPGALSDAQIEAAKSGVSEDLLMRQQISGQILSSVENAETLLKKLNTTMQSVFLYAGCDKRGNNCTGPKRVSVFKDKAQQFFEPYDEIVDEMYDALEMALAVGVDVSDVIMMLSGSCNKWGKYLCMGERKEHVPTTYNEKTCPNGKSVRGEYVKGGQDCSDKMIVPAQDDTRCTFVEFIDDSDNVLRNWVDLNDGDDEDKLIRMGCATSALNSIAIFGRRTSRQGAALDLETLERILLQDAPVYSGNNRFSGGNTHDENIERVKYCALSEKGYKRLKNAVDTKKLPSDICMKYDDLYKKVGVHGVLGFSIADNELTGIGIVPNINEEKECVSSKPWVKDGCHLYWDTVLGCVVSNNCKYTGGYVMTKSDVSECSERRGSIVNGECSVQQSASGTATTTSVGSLGGPRLDYSVFDTKLNIPGMKGYSQ